MDEYRESPLGLTIEYKEAGVYYPLWGMRDLPEIGGAPATIDASVMSDFQDINIDGAKAAVQLTVPFLFSGKTGSTYNILRTFELSRARITFRIIYPEGTVVKFTGTVATKIDAANRTSPLTFSATFTPRDDFDILPSGNNATVALGVLEDVETTVGDFEMIQATVLPFEATITAASSAPLIASVSVIGKQITVQGLAAGAAVVTVTATAGSKTATGTFNVTITAVTP